MASSYANLLGQIKGLTPTGLAWDSTVATVSYFKPDPNVMPRVKTVCIYKHIAGASNDSFLSNALKTLFRLFSLLFDLEKCILSGANRFGHPRGT